MLNVGFDNGEGGVEEAERWSNGRTDEQRALLLERIEAAFLAQVEAGRNIILVYPVPEVGWHVPDTLAMRHDQDRAPRLTTSYDAYLARNRQIIELFDMLSASPNVYPVRPADIFCNVVTEGRCEVALLGQLLYFDTNHLSKFGADLLTDRIVAVIDRLP